MEVKSSRAVEAPTASAVKSDRNRFDAFLRAVPPDGSIAFLREHHMSAPFGPDELGDLRRFCGSSAIPENEFRDRRLERRRRQLLKRTVKFLDCVAQYTDTGQDSKIGVPGIWEEEEPRKLDHAVYLLHRLSDRVVRAYEEFVDAARTRLEP